MASAASGGLQVPRQLIHQRDLLRELVNRDLKDRYRRSIIGIAWSLINPLAQWLVLSIIFTLVVPVRIAHYASFIFIGILVWNWFQLALVMGASAITGSQSLLRQPGLPAALLPVVTLTTNTIHALLAVPVLLLFLLIDGLAVTSAWLLLPLVVVLQYLLSLSLIYLVATANVAFRDTQHILSIALMLLFYLTPVFYDLTSVPEAYRWLYGFNPLTHLLVAYRTILIAGQPPNLAILGGLGLGTLLLLWLSHRWFRRASDHFVEEI